LAQDHQRAKELADVLADKPFVKAIIPVETNIVIFYLDKRVVVEEFLKVLEDQGIRVIHLGHGKLRMVTHLDYTKQMHQKTIELLKKIEV
jgi:threonine aldolase